nr:protein F41H10.10 [imported] - Caenorhabditis elegans [Caenorhabditis elegans]
MAPLETIYDESLNKSADSIDDKVFFMVLWPFDPDRSSNFMTRAIYVAFSAVLRNRNILGQEYFTKNYITEKLKCMTLCFRNPRSNQIAQLLRNAGDATKDGFLKEVSLVITNNEGDLEAIEVFSMKFIYFENGGVVARLSTDKNGQEDPHFAKLAQLVYEGGDSVRDQMVTIVRSVQFLCTKVLEPLPEEFTANFRLEYTNDAPSNFRIDGFEDSSTFYTLPDDIQSATIGHLRPGCHAANMECWSMLMSDSYEAELTLKRHLDKVSDRHGFNPVNVLYKSFNSEDSDTSLSQATTESVNDQGGNETSPVDDITESLEKAQMSPIQTRPTTRRGADGSKTRSSPYSRSCK